MTCEGLRLGFLSSSSEESELESEDSFLDIFPSFFVSAFFVMTCMGWVLGWLSSSSDESESESEDSLLDFPFLFPNVFLDWGLVFGSASSSSEESELESDEAAVSFISFVFFFSVSAFEGLVFCFTILLEDFELESEERLPDFFSFFSSDILVMG